jgi:acid stress chaperone HdeB
MKIVATIIGAALVVASLVTSAPARAEVLDLSTLRCRDFSAISKEKLPLVMMWLEGYHTEEDEPAVIDFDKAKNDTEKLLTYCQSHPVLRMLIAAERSIWK